MKESEYEGYPYRVRYISWKTKRKDLDLPDEVIVDVPEDIVLGDEEEKYIRSYLSTYGARVGSFLYDPMEEDEDDEDFDESRSRKGRMLKEGRRHRGRMMRESASRKYEVTDETMEWRNGEYTLHRIRAIKSFGDVKRGDLGGWIGSEKNLSQEGNCWVFDDAKVYGNAKVYENAEIAENAQVYGDAEVYGRAMIYGNAKVIWDAQVYDRADVSENAIVYGDAEVYGSAMVRGEAQVHGDAIVCGDALVEGDAEIYEGEIYESRSRRGRMLKESEDESSRYKYTIYVDGVEYGYSDSIEEAKDYADDLCAEGHEVEIVDNISGIFVRVEP